MLKGIGASQGFGIGKAVVIRDTNLDYSSVKFTDSDHQKKRLHSAVADFSDETKSLVAELKKNAGKKEAEILEGHLVMLEDPYMLAQMEEAIDNGSVAEAAVDSICTMFINMFSGVDDELTRQRASDVKDIRDSLLRILLGVKSVDISSVPKGSVLARAMGIPAVLSVVNAVEKISDGDMIIADGFKGKVFTDPTEEELEEYRTKQAAYLKEKESLNEYFSKETVTKSGVKKHVYGNIGKAEDAQNVLQNGGEGIGLFRTEFLFMDRASLPTEQEQYEAYSTVAKITDGKEVIIRTLDIGGDKAIDYLKIEKEDNPFLGHRAIRYCLDNPKIFKIQLRAILRAAVFGNIKVMLPLVTTLDEVRRAKALIEECKDELKNEGLKFADTPVGVMIETPSAAIISDLLAKEVDFFSIGTNDLTGYTMAVDRGNAAVSKLYDPIQPAVLRLIETTIKNAKKAGIPVGMCGEAAADTRLIPLLCKWGLDEFSVTPSSILHTRKSICECE